MTTVLITGSTDGLGRYLTGQLAADGVRVLAHGRSKAKLDALVAEVGGDVVPVLADLASLREVDALADQVTAATDRLDVLVSNAGIGGPDERQESVDGIELGFAVNYLAGYRLTRLLLPLLRASAPARIVNVASAGQEPIDFADPMLKTYYDGGGQSYCQSKLAQIMSTMDLAAELAGTGVTVNALHPATFMNTTMVLAEGITPLSTLEEGGAATLRLIRDPKLAKVTGRYFNGTRKAKALRDAYDKKAWARLRELSDDLISRASR